MDFFKEHRVLIAVAVAIIVLLVGSVYRFRRIIFAPPAPPPVRVTFVEGITAQKMATQITETFPDISAETFLAKAQSYEGYLFPDTYFFQSSTTVATILETLRDNFSTKIAPLSSDIRASGHSLADTVVMASLIEKEARTDEDKHLVAGILWNRIHIGMPLQVDAARATYTYKGFPPTPICNPGLDSIEAALYPTKTKYMYYISGKNGLMYYATTFAEHLVNQRKYLY